jgi:tRNA-2-methylthio-N6-dimethylallyladenosine synthase
MKRLHTIERYFNIIDKVKSSPRDVSLTTDIIVGFPGETEDDFLKTVEMVEYCKFDSSYIFKYSPRPGTPAYEMADNVNAGEKTRRFRHLEEVQRRIQNENLQRYLGRTLDVLAEKPAAKSDGDLTGHSTCHRVVNFPGEKVLLGETVKVAITEIKSNSLYGEVVAAA